MTAAQLHTAAGASRDAALRILIDRAKAQRDFRRVRVLLAEIEAAPTT